MSKFYDEMKEKGYEFCFDELLNKPKKSPFKLEKGERSPFSR